MFSIMWRLNIGFLLLPLINIYQIEALTCPYPDADVNTKVTTNGLEPGMVATYSCDTDYVLFGSETRTCGANGDWSGTAPMCATNVAWRKPANQSSTVRGGPPENANDGDRTTVHDGDKCTQTSVEDSPWWSVDLLQEYEISHIRITTRQCCNQQEVQDLEVRVGDSATLQQRNKLCAWYPGALENGATKEFKCARPIKGRYVFVQMVGITGSLSLCEVEVFSKEELSKDRCKGDFDVSKLGLFNRTCYEFQITSGGTFDIAQKYCQKRREGDLVHGIEPMTHKFIVSELERLQSEMPTKMLWIGVQKEPQFISRVWRWIDGTQVSSPTWGKEQPNNYNGEQNCVVLDGGRDWLWNDVGCNLNYLFWMCQFQPSCGTPDRKLNTTLAIKPTENDSVAIYSCPVGNKVEGVVERTCSPTGYWSGEAPSCKYIDCGKPPRTDNGVVSLVDGRTTYGARTTYVCAENYTMDGNNTVTCGEKGSWEPRVPKCLYSWCPEMETPSNGVLTLSGRRSGDTAKFECELGFYLVGEKTLSCVLGGTWSEEPPTCQFVDCGLPEALKNGKMTLVNGTTFVNSVTHYECDEDYWLEGVSTRVCETNGYWGGDIPKCQRINCGEPEIPVGGYVTGYSLDVHSEVDYHCEAGHYMTGESKRTCTREAMWSGEAPVCTFVDCGRLPSIIKGELIFEMEDSPTFLESKVHYRCMPNYRLVGDEDRECLKSGKWSGSNPRCEEIRCGEPEYPPKSRVSVSGNDRRLSLAITRVRHQLPTNATYKVGSQVSYRCERGYVVEGNEIRTCLPNGTWTAEPPKCKFVDCGKPPTFDRGVYRLLSNETSYGAVATFECEANWKIDGKVRRYCQENGTWSGDYPKCIEILCPSISEELQKRYKDEDDRDIDPWNKELIAKREKEKEVRLSADDGTRRVGSYAYYKCQEGQKVVGKQTRLCKQHGVWDGVEPKCEWVFCEKPDNIPNGRVHFLNENMRFGSVVEYFCLPKYYLHGPFNRTCTSNGTWSGVNPRCTLDDVDLSVFEDNTIDGTSNLARGPMDESLDGASYTGIYVGIAVSFFLVLGVILTLLFFKTRESKMAKSNISSSTSSAKPVEHPPPEVMTYLDLHDPSTGNNIYEHIPEDMDSASYTNMSPTSSFTPSPPNSYSNYPNHTYSNAERESHYENSSIASNHANNNNNGKIPHHISRRPRMPPPQPPQVPPGVTSAGVTVNGVTLNTGS